MDVASSQRLSSHPSSHDASLGASGSRPPYPSPPRPEPLSLSATRVHSRPVPSVWPKYTPLSHGPELAGGGYLSDGGSAH